MTENLTLGPLTAAPGQKVQGFLPIYDTGMAIPTTLINGVGTGKTVLVTGGIHSCEYVGIQATIELAAEIDPQTLDGALILMHAVNRSGFEKRMPTLMPEDQKNLNRVFPGDLTGSHADQVAHFFEAVVYPHIDFFLDLHCGEIFEDLTPYIYYVGAADPEVSAAAKAAARFAGVPYMVKSTSKTGAYNYAGILGIPSLLLERGCQGRFTRAEVDADKKDVRNILKFLGLFKGAPETVQPPRDLVDLVYQMPKSHGLWYPEVKPGDHVSKDQHLGTVKDYFGNVLDEYYAEHDAVILYMNGTLWTDDFCELITYGRPADA